MPGKYQITLPAGIYTVELQGAGGAGGDNANAINLDTGGGCGGAGGNGDKVTFDLTVNNKTTFTGFVGRGGYTYSKAGSNPNNGCGGRPGNTTLSYTAGGGGGGGEPTYIQTFYASDEKPCSISNYNINGWFGNFYNDGLQIGSKSTTYVVATGGGGGGGGGGRNVSTAAIIGTGNGGAGGGGGGAIGVERDDNGNLVCIYYQGGYGGNGGGFGSILTGTPGETKAYYYQLVQTDAGKGGTGHLASATNGGSGGVGLGSGGGGGGRGATSGSGGGGNGGTPNARGGAYGLSTSIESDFPKDLLATSGYNAGREPLTSIPEGPGRGSAGGSNRDGENGSIHIYKKVL